jgi:hypothetical protein
MSESRGLRNRPVHCDRSWIVCAGVRTGAAACPIAEMVIGTGHGIDRDSYSAVFPSTSWTHCATSSVGHRQVILRPEGGRVSLVSGGRDCVRDRAIVAPPGHV